jgi:hypothetical protein
LFAGRRETFDARLGWHDEALRRLQAVKISMLWPFTSSK